MASVNSYDSFIHSEIGYLSDLVSVCQDNTDSPMPAINLLPANNVDHFGDNLAE